MCLVLHNVWIACDGGVHVHVPQHSRSNIRMMPVYWVGSHLTKDRIVHVMQVLTL